jgi:hypothetical protein
MKKLNRAQIIGIGFIVIAIITSFLFKNSLIQSISGATIAIGIGFLLKWIPFRKRTVS